MRNVVLKMHISLDGYVVGPDGEVPESFFQTMDDEMKTWEIEGLRKAGVHIMGRATYEEMADTWPASTEEYAPPMNEIPKVVFSHSLEKAEWPESTIATGDLAEEIGRLKQGEDGEVLAHGGARFAQSLTKLDLVDEYRLVVHPVALGGGSPLFGGAVELKRVDAMQFPAGAAALIYERTSATG